MQQYPAPEAIVQPGSAIFRQHGLEAAAKLLLSASGAISAAGEALVACSEQQESLSEGTRALLASLTRAAKQLEGDNALLGQCITICQSLGDIASRYLYGYRNCSTEELPGVTEDLLGALQRCQQQAKKLQDGCLQFGQALEEAAAVKAASSAPAAASTPRQWRCFFLATSIPTGMLRKAVVAAACTALAGGACFMQAQRGGFARQLSGVAACVAGGLAGLLGAVGWRRKRAAKAAEEAARQQVEAQVELPLLRFLQSMAGLCNCVASIQADLSGQLLEGARAPPPQARALRDVYMFRQEQALAVMQASKSCCRSMRDYSVHTRLLSRSWRILPTAAASRSMYAG